MNHHKDFYNDTEMDAFCDSLKEQGIRYSVSIFNGNRSTVHYK